MPAWRLSVIDGHPTRSDGALQASSRHMPAWGVDDTHLWLTGEQGGRRHFTCHSNVDIAIRCGRDQYGDSGVGLLCRFGGRDCAAYVTLTSQQQSRTGTLEVGVYCSLHAPFSKPQLVLCANLSNVYGVFRTTHTSKTALLKRRGSVGQYNTLNRDINASRPRTKQNALGRYSSILNVPRG